MGMNDRPLCERGDIIKTANIELEGRSLVLAVFSDEGIKVLLSPANSDHESTILDEAAR